MAANNDRNIHHRHPGWWIAVHAGISGAARALVAHLIEVLRWW